MLEVLGAALIVVAAYRSRKRMAGLTVTIDNLDPILDNLMTIVRNQVNEERIGFTWLAIGLVLQFIGGFDGASWPASHKP